MGVVRIGVKTPRHIKASSANEADEIALRFARSEKKRTPGKRAFLWAGPNWGHFDDPAEQPSAHIYPDGSRPDMAEYWVIKTDESGIDDRGYDRANDPDCREI